MGRALLAFAALGLVAVGCGSSASSATTTATTVGATASTTTVPVWPTTASAPRYPGTQCKTVAVFGDSVAGQWAARLKATLATSGRCATVLDYGQPGSTADDWQHILPDLLAKDRTVDVWIGHLTGNDEFVPPRPVMGDPAWWTANTSAMLTMTRDVRAAGRPLYWVLPGPTRALCRPPSSFYPAALQQAFAHWQAATLPNTIDLRTPFGGDAFVVRFRFSNGRTAVVRSALDCTHYTPLGVDLGDGIIAARIAQEWR